MKLYGAFNIYFSGYDDKFKGVCGMLLNDHDLYEGNLKTTGKLTNCVLSFNVQGSVFTVPLQYLSDRKIHSEDGQQVALSGIKFLIAHKSLANFS